MNENEKYVTYEQLTNYGIHDIQHQNSRLLLEMNNEYENHKIIHYLSRITGKNIDESTTVLTPFYTDFGQNLIIGKKCFINRNVTMIDLGGIEIGDEVLIASNVTLASVNHPTNPNKRRDVILSKITIKNNVWIGANVTVLSGVTIGENSIVSAHSLVNKDVPANVIVGGIPAKILKHL